MKSSPDICQLLCLIGCVIVLMFMSGCEMAYPDGSSEEMRLNRSLPDLTGDQKRIYNLGQEEFNRIFTPETGLGPIFIAPACSGCHPGDAQGHLVFNLARFGRMVDGRFDPMVEHGGPQLQNRSIPGFTEEAMPETITGTAQFTAPIVGGLGFLEAVDDATILSLADPDDEDGDGISGRPQMIDETDFLDLIASREDVGSRFIKHDGQYIGRFGRKASNISLLLQTVSAFKQDMGLSTDLMDDIFNVQETGISSHDSVPDPEVSSSVVSSVVFFLKTVQPPRRRNADNPDVKAGELLFEQVGCTSCHISTLMTGKSSISQLSEKQIHPYTDLLLHDMGSELNDNYTEGNAELSEWRTAPLWGLGLAERFQGGDPFYLHDGRARSLTEAILYHGGEAASSRSAFTELSESEKEQLLKFLKSL